MSDAFDTEKLLDSMDKLRHSQAVDIPKYDFKSYKSNLFPARRVWFGDVQQILYSTSNTHLCF
ncbi:hypothetical protein SLEP1_g51710 [Rubroshorea leprosula]|uniref:Uncharacterized protein n=1 Tax=Rubroshorea leprosula TaxID=152421 RepID=A0AAV5M6L7_9ROSI|nr:hypothetical protein SLEP1_g51710 [Rubroshorea leprosula]